MIINDWGGSDHTPGTEDWVEVASYGGGGGYEWAVWRCWWSPSANRYFYDGDSGCSCNSWEPPKQASGFDFTDSKDGLVKALEAFAESHYEKSALELVSEIRAFKKPKEYPNV